jgi:hypothetical protein
MEKGPKNHLTVQRYRHLPDLEVQRKPNGFFALLIPFGCSSDVTAPSMWAARSMRPGLRLRTCVPLRLLRVTAMGGSKKDSRFK